MNIGFDISSLVFDRGVSRYTSNLIRALLAKKNIKLNLYGASFRQFNYLQIQAERLKKRQQYTGQTKLTLQKLPPSLLDLLWRFGLNSIKKQMPKIDLFHSWDWLQPPDNNLPLVSTIHDLAILKFPKDAHPKIVKTHLRSFEILKKRQAHIIAVSQSTKRDIINILQIPAWRISVIHEALPEEIKQISDLLTEDEVDQIKHTLQLNKPYLFFVGTREPRKNLLRIIQAWESMKNDFQLIIAGDAGWDETSQKQKNLPNSVRQSLNHPQLKFLGKVTDGELAVLYSEASAFVYPSLYEGFGLPILEAFYHGTPVITANNSSMIEVAGNAAELVDPESVESIKTGIEKILNENLSQQQTRMQRMIIRLQMFNWAKVAEQTIEVYQKVLEQEN